MIRKRKINRAYIGGVIVLVLIVGALGSLGYLGNLGVRGVVEEAGSWVRRGVWEGALGIGGIFNRGRDKGKDQGKDRGSLEELRRRVVVLEGRVGELEEENAAFRSQLEAPLAADLTMLPARVIGKSRYLFIDKGRRDGVAVGQGVVAEEVFVGTVVAVGERTGRVRLLDDKETKLTVRTNLGSLGLLGGLGGKMRITRVEQGDELGEGDLVLTAGDEEVPGGILVGEVGEVGGVGEVYREGVVVPGIEYERLRFVFVVR